MSHWIPALKRWLSCSILSAGMTPFQFRLAAVLRFRERLLEEKQGELQQLNAARRQLEDEINALEAAAARSEDTMHRFSGQIFSVNDLLVASEYGQALRQRADDKRARVPILEDEIAAKLEEVVEARRQVKSLEQLRQRREARYRKELALEQQKFADETSQRQFIVPHARKKLP